MFRTLLISLCLTSTALATTWTVDNNGKADFNNIQAAVDASSDGDEIVVMPGTYTSTADEVVNMLGKAVWLHSSDGQEVTIIDGESVRRGILCVNSETSNTIIEGFTITRGFGNRGGGAYCENGSSPSIISCIFYTNSSQTNGAGVGCMQDSNPIITNCSFISNSNEIENYPGAGVGGSYYCNPLITDTYFCDNWPTHMVGDWTDGGGTCFSFSCNDSDGDGRPDECDTVGDGVHHVPEEYKTIQEAIYAAGDHDEIIVGPGTYTCEDPGSFLASVFNPGGKRLWIHSSNGPELTVIDSCNGSTGLFFDSGETPETLIEGFTFSFSGQQDYTTNVYCFMSSPTIRDCIISDSTGIGMSVHFCSPIISNCTFLNNNGYRGGMYNWGSSPTITNCTFENNTASNSDGGGMHNLQSSPTLDGCTFIGNTADNGGGMYNSSNSSPTLTNCTFTNNTANSYGGGMCNDSSNPTLTNCRITANTANDEGGGMFNFNSTPTLTNTTVCGNTPDQIGGGGYTDGGGNTVADVCCPDINGDGIVNVSDLLSIIDQWGLTNSPADLNFDGIVDVSDLLIVVGNWGPCE